MYKLFTDVLISKGFTRDLLVDIGRGNIKLIPKEITELIDSFENLNKVYSKEENSIIKELLANEIIFEITSKEIDFFPLINLEWNNPSNITNGILEISKLNIDFIKTIFEQFENLQCYFFTIILIDDFTKKQYKNIFNVIADSSIISYELILNYYENNVFADVLDNILELKNQVKKPIIFNCNKKDVIKKFKEKIIFRSEFYDNKLCGCIKKDSFSVNMDLFTESQKFNTCLNRKLSIDKDGNIKNCPSMNQNFGNIKDVKLDQIIKKADFKKYWNIKKDDISVCKDCEFRHICTDCRAFTENPNDIYSKPLKCGYSPYTNEWEDWSTNKLKQKTIEYYNMQELALKK